MEPEKLLVSLADNCNRERVHTFPLLFRAFATLEQRPEKAKDTLMISTWWYIIFFSFGMVCAWAVVKGLDA